MKTTILFQSSIKITMLLLMAFVWTLSSFAQPEYYSTNGTNRLTKVEVDEQVEAMKQKVTKALKQDMFVDIEIKNTETKADSIIHSITYAIHDGKIKQKEKESYIASLKDQQFPDFELKTLLGDNFNSEELNGKPTMINFWFTKCAPCIDEMPVLNLIYDQYKNDINFIAITYETEEKVVAFLEKHPFKFKHLVDAQKFTDALELQAYPLNLFLDANGILKYIENGIAYVIKEGEKGMKMGDGKEIIAILEKLK